MAKLALNKSALARERARLKLYAKLLPSLELKRQQLMMEFGRSRTYLADSIRELDEFQKGIAEQVPMMADREIDLSGLVRLDAVDLGVENVVGVKLPVLKQVHTTVADYSLLGKPHWVDVLIERLHQTVERRLRVQVAEERVRRMEQAVRKITQRVNLFEKIMIPTAKKNIKRIQIFMGDAERSAVVRSKIAKRKRLAARKTFAGGIE